MGGFIFQIAVVINAKYLIHMFTMLCSLFLTNEKKNFKVFILYSDLETEHKNQIEAFFNRFHQSYILIKVEASLFENAPLLDPNMSLEAYYKLLLPLQLPDNLEKVLYLDSDIIINGKIDELFECNLGGKAFAAVKDFSMDCDLEYKTRLMKPENTYFNSGVLLIDMKVLRKIYDWKRIQKYIESEGKNFRFHDQEVLNAIFNDNVKIIDEKYNYLTMYRHLGDLINYFLHYKKDDTTRKVVVIHYALSGNKPWMPLYRGKFLANYWKFRCFFEGKTEYRKFQVKRGLYIPIRIFNIMKIYFIPRLRQCINKQRDEMSGIKK